MKKGKNTAEILGSDNESDDMELSETGNQERTLILKATPPSRRLQLIASGAREIRCSCCRQIKPLAGAEDSDEGWVCKDCVKTKQKGRYNRQKGN